MSAQGRQAAILDAIFSKIGTTNKYFVEFGFNAPSYEGGSGANTASLYQRKWRGLLLDGRNANASINLHTTYIMSTSIVDTFRSHNVPSDLDYLSIDIDSADLWVLKAILASYQPRVISIEYNSNYDMANDNGSSSSLAHTAPSITVPDPATMPILHGRGSWRGTCYFGASPRALVAVAHAFGYSLVAVEAPYDLFFVRTPTDVWRDPSSKAPWSKRVDSDAALKEAFSPSSQLRYPIPNHEPLTLEEAANLLDYEVYVKTGSVCEARAAAAKTLRRLASHANHKHKHANDPKHRDEYSNKALRYKCFRQLSALKTPESCESESGARPLVQLGRADG